MKGLLKAGVLGILLLCTVLVAGTVEGAEVLYEDSLSEIGDDWRIDHRGEIVDGGLNYWANVATLMKRFGNVAYEFEVEWKDMTGALPDVESGFGVHLRKRGPFDSYTSTGYLLIFRPAIHPEKDKDKGTARFWFLNYVPDGLGSIRGHSGADGWLDFVYELSEGTGVIQVKIVTDSEKIVVYLDGEQVREIAFADMEGIDDAPTFSSGYFSFFQQKKESEKIIYRNLRITSVD